MTSATAALDNDLLSSRLGPCEICEQNTAKYTCPACELRTCSVRCVAQHKRKYDCDGIRSRINYIPLKKFGDLELLNDYRLLEEMGRTVREFANDKTKRYSRLHNGFPTHLFRLRRAAQHRGIRYYILPEHFVRQKNNTTYFDWTSKRISWKVQITFLHSEMLTFNEDRCMEMVLVKDLVQKYLQAKDYARALKPYVVAGMDQIDVLMKAEKISESTKKFYKLDPLKSLKDNFCGKVIVGYPQIFLAIKNYYSAKVEDNGNAKTQDVKLPGKDFLRLKTECDSMDGDSSGREDIETEVKPLSSPVATNVEGSVEKKLPSYLDMVKNDDRSKIFK